MSEKRPVEIVREVLTAMEEERWEEILRWMLPARVKQVSDAEIDSLKYTFKMCAEAEQRGEEYWGADRDRARRAWRISHPNELDVLPPGEVFIRYLAVDGIAGTLRSARGGGYRPFAEPFFPGSADAPPYHLTIGEVFESDDVAHVVFRRQKEIVPARWWDKVPARICLATLVRTPEGWRLDVDRSFLEHTSWRAYRGFPSEQEEQMHRAFATSVAGVWRDLNSGDFATGENPLFSEQFVAQQLHRIAVDTARMEEAFTSLFRDPIEALRAIVEAGAFNASNAIGWLLAEPSRYGEVHPKFSTEDAFRSALVAYGGRRTALHCLGLPVSLGIGGIRGIIDPWLMEGAETEAGSESRGREALEQKESHELRSVLGAVAPELLDRLLKRNATGAVSCG